MTAPNITSTIPDDGSGSVDLSGRAAALEAAASLAAGRLPDESVEHANRVAAKVRARLRHGTDRTVVALAGPTGAGKSSLFNALIGSDVSTPGVKRPTTSVAHAALWGGDEPRLLRWLEVPRRYLVDEPNTDLDGLILIDLPDVDSIESANRLEAERLIDVVDAMVWVLDPQKYADEVVHGHIAALAAHSDVLRFVVTKIDLVDKAERTAMVDDLASRLGEDGIENPVIWPVSLSASGPSESQLDAARTGLVSIVSDQRALANRLQSDIRNAAGSLSGESAASVEVSANAIRDAALPEVSAAAKIGELSQAVSVQYQREARRATGWLPMEWLRRRRPSEVTARGDQIDRLRVESALRAAAEVGTADIGAPWDAIVRREVMGRSDDVADALRTRSVNVARHIGARPRWWSLFSYLQRLLLLGAVVGVMWLLALAVVGGLGLDTEPLNLRIGPTPIPSALVIGGIGIGILLGLLARLPARAGGARRAKAARREMVDETSAVLDTEVVAPIEHVLSDRAEIDRLVRVASGR